MIIYETAWWQDGEISREFFLNKREAIAFAESYPVNEDGEQYQMRVIKIITPRPSSELLFSVIKSQGGGYAISQNVVWKNAAQEEHEETVKTKLGWEGED